MDLKTCEAIKKHYDRLTKLILERSEIKNSFWVDPYCDIDWFTLLTPIEYNMWTAIRGFGHAPFYPQYPVGNYFLDFANPSIMVGIECDGALYHQDKEKDKKRDKWLADNGWIIYRISGSDCVKEGVDIESNIDISYDERCEGERFNYLNTCYGLIKAIGIYHFNYYPFFPQLDQVAFAAECLSNRLSIKSQFHQVLLDKVMQKFYSEQEKTIY